MYLLTKPEPGSRVWVLALRLLREKPGSVDWGRDGYTSAEGEAAVRLAAEWKAGGAE